MTKPAPWFHVYEQHSFTQTSVYKGAVPVIPPAPPRVLNLPQRVEPPTPTIWGLGRDIAVCVYHLLLPTPKEPK